MKKHNIKAILYDLDGVLINTKTWHFDALNSSLLQYGLNISEKDHDALYEGLPTLEKLKILSKQQGLDKKFYPEIIRRKNAELLKILKKNCEIDENRLNILKHFQVLGLKQALCTNTSTSTVDWIVNNCRLKEYLDLILSRNHIVNPKPNPEIYIKAINFFNLNPEDCLIIEDSEHGINAAKKAGAGILIVNNYFSLTFEKIMKAISL